MVFFPDQALRFPDPEGGSRSLARGLSVGNQARRTELARLQQGVENERATASDQLKRDQFGLLQDRVDISRGTLDLAREKSEREQLLENTNILGSILTGVAASSDEAFPQALRAGIETANRLGVDTAKYDGLTQPEARAQIQTDLISLQGLQKDVLSPRAFQQQRDLREAGKPETKINFGSEVQNKAATFASRMEAADKIITEFEAVGSESRSAVGNALPNILKPEELQVLDTAARDLTGAILRKESGAAIPTNEIVEAFKVYIPQPGDGQRTLDIKRANRARAIENMRREAGPVDSIRDIPGIVDPTEASEPTFRIEGGKLVPVP